MTILIACGLQREAKLLAGPGIVAVPGGGDAVRLAAALDAKLDICPGVTMILSCGIAGALDPSLRLGEVVIYVPSPFAPSDVEDRAISATPETPPSTSLGANGVWPDCLAAILPHARHGTIIGQDHIAATATEKAALHAATGALAVDMETHIVASVAARHGLPFMAIRTISDTARETLPPAALVGINPDGSMALGKVLTSLARRPGQLPALIRTGRSAEAAFRALGTIGEALRSLP